MSDEKTRRTRRAFRRAAIKGERRQVAAGLTPSNVPFLTAVDAETSDIPEIDFGFSASPEEVTDYLAAQNHGSPGTTFGAIFVNKLG